MISAFGIDHGEISKAYGRGPAMDAARWTAGIAGVGGAGGGATVAVERRKGAKRRDAEHVAAAGVLGGGAAQGVYQAIGYEAKHRTARAEAKAGLSRAKKDKKLKPVKRAHGAFTPGMYRNYPKDLPGAKTHRALGYTHRGKTGTALGTAVTLAGAAGAIKATKKAKEKP